MKNMKDGFKTFSSDGIIFLEVNKNFKYLNFKKSVRILGVSWIFITKQITETAQKQKTLILFHRYFYLPSYLKNSMALLIYFEEDVITYKMFKECE